ncbi:MAG TPA: LCP family protein, partial [Acidimicrobiales bacterium]|nr:LCP family protein [Acidimicrobiales bacterium]
MARRDRRRGGAHSAPRNSGSPPPDPSAGETSNGGDDEAGPAPVGTGGDGLVTADGILAGGSAAADSGVAMTRKDRKAARRSSSGRSGGGTGPSKKRKHRWLDRLLLAGIVVVVLALAAMGGGFAYVQYRFHQVTKVTVRHLKKAPVGQPFNVLLIGSDSRVGESAAQAAHFGSESETGGQRSDVVKIVHIIPATGQVSVLSIPRDTMVTVVGNTSEIGKYNRINSTYNSGPDQLVQTIEANFGIPIEHVVQIDFEGLEGAVDAIGGIHLDFPYPAKDTYTGLQITQTGCQLVNGGYSLALARSRHYEYYKDGYWQYDGTSDFGRIQRQNAFLKAVINQAESKYNPLTLNAFVGSVVHGVTVDSTFSISDLISLAREFHTFSSNSLATATLPTFSQSSELFSSLGDVLYVQQPQALQVITQFLGEAPDTVYLP